MTALLLGPGRVLLGLGILVACGYLVATHDTDPTVRESGGLRAVYNGIALAAAVVGGWLVVQGLGALW
jgi:hypothetical protein